MKLENNSEDFRKNIHKLWYAEKHCDVILIPGDGSIRIQAHRLVLEASSPYFEKLTTSANGNVKEIALPAINAFTLQRLVGACYSGSLEVDEDDVSRLYTDAVHLELNSLINTMDNYIVAQLNNSNCLHFYLLAESLSRSMLFEAAEHYICEHFIEITDQPSFLELEGEKLKNLMASEDLIVPSAEDLFRNVIKWIQHDPEGQRNDVFSELLPNLRLSSMSLKFLMEYVKPHCKTIETKEIVFAAIETQFTSRQSVSTATLNSESESGSSVSSDVEKGTLIVVCDTFPEKSKIMEYSFELKKWNILAELPTGVGNFTVIHSRALNSLCFVGGVLNGQRRDDVVLWNLKTRSFSNLKGMIESCSWPAVASINAGTDKDDSNEDDEDDDLIVVGGWNNNSDISRVDRWSRKSGAWHSLEDLNASSYGARLVTFDNLIYSIGGCNKTGYLKSVECYNLLEKKWSTVAPLQHGRYNCGTWIDKGKIYIIGGDSDMIECYDPENNEWTEVCTVADSAKVKTCVWHDGSIFAFGWKILLISDGDWKIWETDNSIDITDKLVCGAFSIPLQ